jgi:vitamin B12 transporter
MQTKADFDTNIGGYVSTVDQTRNNSAVFTSYDHLIGTDTVLTFGARQDWLSDFDDVQTYRIGASKNGWRTAYSTAFKEPTAYEQHGTDNWGFQGNPNLKPEHTRTVEIGYANTAIDVAVYKTEIEDLLKYLNNTYTNDTGTSVRHGADVGINYAVNDWQIANTTSYVRAEDSTGVELTRRPKWHNTLDIAYTIDPAQQLHLQHNYYGSHRDINSTTWAVEDQPSVSTVDIGYKFRHRGKTVSAGLNNMFDKTYERPNGYSQQGQNFELGIRIEF